MKAKELRQKSAKELHEMQLQLAKEAFMLRTELATSRKLDKPHQMRQKRRDRARVLAVLHEKSM